MRACVHAGIVRDIVPLVIFWVRLRGNVYQILFYGKLGVVRVLTSQ